MDKRLLITIHYILFCCYWLFQVSLCLFFYYLDYTILGFKYPPLLIVVLVLLLLSLLLVHKVNKSYSRILFCGYLIVSILFFVVFFPVCFMEYGEIRYLVGANCILNFISCLLLLSVTKIAREY